MRETKRGNNGIKCNKICVYFFKLTLITDDHRMKFICSVLCIFLITSLLQAQKDFNIGFVTQVRQPYRTNDIWGYVAPNGTEYAVIGTERDCRIYSLVNPGQPELVDIVSGARSIWRDFKTFDQFVYEVTQVGQDGLTIIDMRNAPQSISSVRFQDTIVVEEVRSPLETCHNLWIDTDKGLAFLAGCNIGVGGVLVLDIATDPLQPIHVGTLNERYAHDVITRGDTLFASEINEGNLGIYDISNLSSPRLISRVRTGSSFTHNAWPSDDGNYVFTTDERPDASLEAYDIRNIENPQRIDQFRPMKGMDIIPHNTHYYNGFLVTSWYVEGVIIVDAHRPDNLVKVGEYDTYLLERQGFEGAWGAYPYLPSGLVLVSDLSGGLFVLQPEYKRAAYLEGNIVDAQSGFPVNAAIIKIGDEVDNANSSNALGDYKTGVSQSGTYQVIVEHPDYFSDTLTIELTAGMVVEEDIRLVRKSSIINIAGYIVDEAGKSIPNAGVLIQSADRQAEAYTDETGLYRSNIAINTYDVYVGAWGYKGKKITRDIFERLQEPIVLEKGYEDDFFVDLGWTSSGDAVRGNWTRAIPVGTFYNSSDSNPSQDVPDDLNEYCFVTGNNSGSVGADDVDDGTAILTSPDIDVSEFQNAIIEITPWFFNDGGASLPNDTMKIFLESDRGEYLTYIVIDNRQVGGRWYDPIQIFVDSIYRRERIVRLRIEVNDHPDSGHLVEGGIDKFRVYEGPLPVYPDNQEEIEVAISPNPSNGILYVEPRTNEKLVRMIIFDLSGKVIFDQRDPEPELELGFLPEGIYTLEFLFSSGVRSSSKWIKL